MKKRSDRDSEKDEEEERNVDQWIKKTRRNKK